MHELRSAATPTAEEAMDWIGSRVDDIHGKAIGRLDDVRTGPGGAETTWLLVRYGGGGEACTLIPLREASPARRRVWVRFDRDFVRNAPWVNRHAPMSQRTHDEFARYYGLDSASRQLRQPGEPVTATRPRRREVGRPRRRFEPAGAAAVSARAKLPTT